MATSKNTSSKKPAAKPTSKKAAQAAANQHLAESSVRQSAKPVSKKAPAKKATTKKAAPAPKPAPVAKAKKANTYAEMQANRFTESKVESPVRAMWDLCDNMTSSRRKDVIAAAVEKGISFYTARTQYQLWLTAYRNSK